MHVADARAAAVTPSQSIWCRLARRMPPPNGKENQLVRKRPAGPDDRYRWVAPANTTAAMFMATLDGSIVIIALPATFRGIHLDPLAPGNIGYLLWMITGTG